MTAPRTLNTELHLKFYNDVVLFRNTFDLSVNEPENYTPEHESLHESLKLEELVEIATADSLVKSMDGVIDTIYVTYGKLVQLGFRSIISARKSVPEQLYLVELLLAMATRLTTKEKFLACWDNIQASNLSKVCTDEKQVKKTEAKYRKLGVPTYTTTNNYGTIFKVGEDITIGEIFYPKDKVLKSASYIPADLTQIL